MTAAPPPAPPPHLTPVTSINANSYQGSANNALPPHHPARNYAHIKDLVATAQNQINPNFTTKQLLDRASNALQSAPANIQFQRPDYAFVEFVVAQHIISKSIPSQPNWRSEFRDHPRLQAQYDESLSRLRKARDVFDRVTFEIQHDNERSGVRPRQETQAAIVPAADHDNRRSFVARVQDQGQRPQSVQLHRAHDDTTGSSDTNLAHRNSIAAPQGPAATSTRDQQNGTRPIVQAKPLNLKGSAATPDARPSSQSSNPGRSDPLLARFSNMRVTGSPEPSAYAEATQIYRSQSSNYQPQSRPAAAMQLSTSKGLPKVPSPTYSPAKAMPDDTTFRTSQLNRNSIGGISDATSLASTTSYQPHQDEYQPLTGAHQRNGIASSQSSTSRPNSRAENLPQETQINAQRLYDYLQQFSVLLIDVRPRTQFDAGHVFGHVLCIEPAALRPQRSAEELQEALVLGPEQEYEYFAKRQEFDLVVYYDASTRSTAFLDSRAGEDSPLKCLHDTLYHYNHDKPLKWQPILLVGGLEAWVDLVGPQALQTSSTAADRATKIGRPIARRPLVSNNSKLSISRKRHRDYNPLDPEEERKWRERARSESVVVQLPSQDAYDGQSQGHDEVDTDITGTQDSFQHKYPDVASVENQVMSSRPPSRVPPQRPEVPSYPAAPAPSIPSRPPPALARPSYSGVSERAMVHNSAPRTTHPPYIPPKLLNLPRTGLVNFGVTCYMNATIQCLSATLPLTRFFLDNRWQDYVQKDNWKGSKGIMTAWYNTLLTNIWRPGDAETIRPGNFRKVCARLNREWGIDRQQDAKEFLDFLVDTLHEDLNVNWARNPLRALTPQEEAMRERTPYFFASKGEYQRYLHRDSSKMTDLFAGQHISRLQCTKCSYTSTTYETFYSISVEIPDNRGRPVSLHDCLRSYTTSEVLAGEEVWHCPQCRVDRETKKQIIITRAPDHLVIHLKRFSASHTERAKKVHTPVDFPLHGLDMGPYMLAPPDAKTSKQIATLNGQDALLAPPQMTPPYRYDAYAVMRHLGGTMGSGHYIALVEDKSKSKWREFNDEKVNDFLPQDLSPRNRLQNEQAYIIFYQRVWQ